MGTGAGSVVVVDLQVAFVDEEGVADSSDGGDADESESDAGVSGPPVEAPSDDETGSGSADDFAEDAGISVDGDDVDLPEGVTIDEVIDAVRTAKTLFDVQRDLGVERVRTRELLTELDFLDLVHGRLSTTPDRPRSREEIERRIESAVADPRSPEPK